MENQKKRAPCCTEEDESSRKLRKLEGGNGAAVGGSSEVGKEKLVAVRKRAASRKRVKTEFKYPVEPRTIIVIKKPRTIMNHSYRDFSIVPPELDYEHPKDIKDMTFSQKIHDILSTKDYAPFISWMPHGRSFRVHIPKIFEEQICSKYFGHSRYSSFLRLLNNYGFKHITQGTDRNCYYHECFLRGMPHLCKYMPQPKNARRLIPDPENEPDFYRLSELFPVPERNISVEAEDNRKPAAKPRSCIKRDSLTLPKPGLVSSLQDEEGLVASLEEQEQKLAATIQEQCIAAAVLQQEQQSQAATVAAAALLQQERAAAREIRAASLLTEPRICLVGLGRGLSPLTPLARPSSLGLANHLLQRQQVMSQAASLDQSAVLNAALGLGSGRGLGSRRGLGLSAKDILGGFPF